MYKKLCFLFILSLLLALPSYTFASPLVRVGLVNGKDSVTIISQRPFSIINVKNNHIIANGKAGDKWRVEYRNGQLYLNNQLVEGPFVFRMEPGDDNEYLIADGRRYRGELEVRTSQTKRGLTLIEILSMEEYVYGIIPWEISPAWPVEAVKAQAVAARTYALYHLGKHKKDGFDLCTTTDCQVYGGREAEDPRGNWAVDATQGMVVTYKSNLIPAFFHSSGGGYTENMENVWNAKADYIRGVPDYDQSSPYYQWKAAFSPEEITKKLESAGHIIGTLQGVKLSPLHAGVNSSPDRGISGRVKAITFMGNKGETTLTGNEVRQLFKLSSTLFDIKTTGGNKTATAEPTKAAANVPALASATAPSGMIGAKTATVAQPEKKRKKRTKASTEPASQKQTLPDTPPSNVNSSKSTLNPVPETPVVRAVTQGDTSIVITFEGYGSGHGLGLSQWGAKAMAEQGPKDDRTYYQQILKHYYQGVDITKWY